MSNVSCNYWLNNVCSIKTINTVSPNNPYLVTLNHHCLTIKLFLFIESMLKLSHKVIIRIKLWLNLINQLTNVIVLHLSTFMMKVKPNICNLWVINLFNYISKCISDHALLLLFINEIHTNDVLVFIDLLWKMKFCDLLIQNWVITNLNLWFPF